MNQLDVKYKCWWLLVRASVRCSFYFDSVYWPDQPGKSRKFFLDWENSHPNLFLLCPLHLEIFTVHFYVYSLLPICWLSILPSDSLCQMLNFCSRGEGKIFYFCNLLLIVYTHVWFVSIRHIVRRLLFKLLLYTESCLFFFTLVNSN